MNFFAENLAKFSASLFSKSRQSHISSVSVSIHICVVVRAPVIVFVCVCVCECVCVCVGAMFAWLYVKNVRAPHQPASEVRCII